MPSVYQLKPAFQAALRSLLKPLVSAGITPNVVTATAALMSFVVGALILLFPTDGWPLILVGPVLFLRMALNAIDGMLAREHDLKTPLGAVLNELGDVLSDSALYLPLATRPGIAPLLMVPAVVLGVVSEMTGVVAVQIGAERRYDGPMGKSDRALCFGALALLAGVGVRLDPWVSVFLSIVLLLLVATIVNRARGALAAVRQ